MATGMKPSLRRHERTCGFWWCAFVFIFAVPGVADENLDGIKKEIDSLKKRVAALEEENAKLKTHIDVERLTVRKELIVSDSGQPWEKGFEEHQIPRGIYARS